MQVGQNAYEADVLTAIKTDQWEIFYDIVDIKSVKIETSDKAHIESEDSRSSGPEVSVEASGGTHVESEDSRSRLPKGSGDTSTSLPKAMLSALVDTQEVSSKQSIAQTSDESNATEAAVLKTTLKRLIEQVSSALPNRHMRLKNFVQFS